MADIYSFVSSDGKTGVGEDLWEAIENSGSLPWRPLLFNAPAEVEIPSITEIGNSHTRRGGLVFSADGSWIGAFIVE